MNRVIMFALDITGGMISTAAAQQSAWFDLLTAEVDRTSTTLVDHLVENGYDLD